MTQWIHWIEKFQQIIFFIFVLYQTSQKSNFHRLNINLAIQWAIQSFDGFNFLYSQGFILQGKIGNSFIFAVSIITDL